MRDVVAIAIVELVVLLLSVVLAVVARVGLARRAGGPMPEGVLFQRSTWVLVLLAFVPLSLAGLSVGPFSIEPASDGQEQPSPSVSPITSTTATTPTTPTTTSTTDDTVTTETTPLTPQEPKVENPAARSRFADCTAGGALRTTIPGYRLRPAPAKTVRDLRATYRFATQVAARTVTDGSGTTVATVVALCPARSLAATERQALAAAQRELARDTGETVASTSFTTGGTTIEARRTDASDSYTGTWVGRRTVYLVTDTTTATVEPFLRAAAPRLRR